MSARARVVAVVWVALLAHGSMSAAEGRWTAAPSMLHARAAHAVVSDGRQVFALGGTGADGRPVTEVERFDGTRWQIETSLPGRGLNAPAAVLLDGRIHLIGGFDMASNVPSTAMWIYELATRRWEQGPPLPAPRGGHAAVVWNGRIHVLGGGNAESTIADHSVYDPATRRWREAARLPRAEGSPAAVVFDGRLYAIGGRSGFSDFGDVFVYDAAADAWSNGPAIGPRGTAGALVYCGAIHLFGGESQAEGRSLGEVLRLDARRGLWEMLAPLPTPRNFARAVPFGDAVLVVGGDPQAGNSHGGNGSAVVERFETRCPS